MQDKMLLDKLASQDIEELQILKREPLRVYSEQFLNDPHECAGFIANENYVKNRTVCELFQRLSGLICRTDGCLTIPFKRIETFTIAKQNPFIPPYLHRHTYFELDYVYKGTCNYYIDSMQEPVRLNQHEFCLVNGNVAHAIELLCKDDIVFKLNIPYSMLRMDTFADIEDGTLIKDFFRLSLRAGQSYFGYVASRLKTEVAISLLLGMLEEFFYKKQGWQATVESLLSLFWVEIARNREKVVSAGLPRTRNASVLKALDLIESDFKSISLKDLASDMHFHQNYLSRLIKQSTQMSFSELVVQARLKEARKLLKYSDCTVEEISAMIGYTKPTYLYKVFKDKLGMTPTQYRNKRSHFR